MHAGSLGTEIRRTAKSSLNLIGCARGEFVAESANRHDSRCKHLRGAQLRAEPPNVHVHSPSSTRLFVTSDFPRQILAGDHFIETVGESGEQSIFRCRNGEGLGANQHASLHRINRQVRNVSPLARIRPRL